MKHEFTAIFERDGDWHIAYCQEIPVANGQGQTKGQARQDLLSASLFKIIAPTNITVG